MESQKSYPFFIGGDQMKRAENKLRDVRVLKRLTQMDLQLATDINHTKISWIENGYVIPRSMEKIKLADALGVTPKELFPEDCISK